MSWLETNSGAIAALSSVLLTVITIVYVYLTGRLVKESQATRAAMLLPELAIYLHPLEGSPNFVLLYIENIGAGPARSIKLSTDRPFKTEHTEDLRDVGIFRKGISYLAPRQRIEHFLISVIGKLDELMSQPLKVSASYQDALGKAHRQEFVLDFGELENLAWIGVPPLQEIAKAVKKLQEDFGRVATGFNKLQVLTEPASDYYNRVQSESLARRLERIPKAQRDQILALVKEKEQESQPAQGGAAAEGAEECCKDAGKSGESASQERVPTRVPGDSRGDNPSEEENVGGNGPSERPGRVGVDGFVDLGPEAPEAH